MAWLHNLAGKAEDLLNKIDKNAATVLSESNRELELKNSKQTITDSAESAQENTSDERSEEPIKLEMEEPFENIEEIPQLNDELGLEKLMNKSFNESVMLSSVSSQSSLKLEANENQYARFDEEIVKFETQCAKMQTEILQLKHLNSKLESDNASLSMEYERAQQVVLQSQQELNEYKMKARKRLEKQVTILQEPQFETLNSEEIIHTNNQLRLELEKEIQKCVAFESKVASLQKELLAIQQQYLDSQKQHNFSVENMNDALLKEKAARDSAEDETRVLKKECQRLYFELQNKAAIESNQKMEIAVLVNKLKDLPRRTSLDAESRMQTLTETLMHKQNTLDTITCERNALKLQLEKLEASYLNLQQLQKQSAVTHHKVIEVTDIPTIPKFTKISNLDDRVTQRVKKAYSSLDAFSIRTGVFLRRYPLARIFLICYMVILHIWVLLVLFTYMPGPR